jgi:hypothetical protein
MTPVETRTGELRRRADEIDWRYFWLTNVMIDTGKPRPARPVMRTRKEPLARRLNELRRLRSVLEPPR